MSKQNMTFKAVMLTIFWALVIWAAIGFFLLAVMGSISFEPSQSKAGEPVYDTGYTISVTNNTEIISQVIYYLWFWPFVESGPLLLEE